MEIAEIENDLPPLDVMIAIICDEEGISEEEAKQKIQKEQERNKHLFPEGAAYSYLVKLGISDDYIDNFNKWKD